MTGSRIARSALIGLAAGAVITAIALFGPSSGSAGAGADGLGRVRLESTGTRIHEFLDVGQRKDFFRLFRAGKLVPVKFETEPMETGPDRGVLAFGWRDLGDASLRISLGETERRLDRAWQMIPSEERARQLLEHPNDAVAKAASTWLASNAPPREAPPPRLAQQRPAPPPAPAESHDERRQRMHERHEERVGEMRARHHARVQEMLEEHDERVYRMELEQGERREAWRREREDRLEEWRDR
jgi:hypothetical protein